MLSICLSFKPKTKLDVIEYGMNMYIKKICLLLNFRI